MVWGTGTRGGNASNSKTVLKLSLILKRKLEWGRLGKPQSGPRIRTSIVNHDKNIQVNVSYIMRFSHHVM